MTNPNDQADRNAFAQLVIARLQELGVSGDISYDPDEFQITAGDEEAKSILFLGNAFQEYRTVSEENRPQALRRFVRGWLQAHKPTPEEYADIQPDILPAVRSRSFFESARLRMMIEDNQDMFLPYQMLGDDLGVGLVYDLPDAMRPIPNKEFDLWGVTFYEALEAARDNLAHVPPQIIGPKDGEGTYVFTTNDGYDSSRLILLDLIRQFQVTGDYIAMAPTRGMLIVTGSDDKQGLEAMVALTKKALEQPRAVSGIALRLDRDEWESWMPDAGHPLYQEFRLLRMRTHGQDYAEQKELLDALHQKTGEDVFVASFSAAQHRDTGRWMSYCTWQKGVHSLLPRTERIVLGGDDPVPVMVAWEKVVDVAGDLLTPMEMYPERYRVEGFPTAEQLAAMGNELTG